MLSWRRRYIITILYIGGIFVPLKKDVFSIYFNGSVTVVIKMFYVFTAPLTSSIFSVEVLQ